MDDKTLREEVEQIIYSELWELDEIQSEQLLQDLKKSIRRKIFEAMGITEEFHSADADKLKKLIEFGGG